MRRDKPLLIGWNRSAYARRVAISMHVYGIEFEQRAQTAWDHFDEVRRFNPIVKIPALADREWRGDCRECGNPGLPETAGSGRSVRFCRRRLRCVIGSGESLRSPPRSSTRGGSCDTRCICARRRFAMNRGSSDGAMERATLVRDRGARRHARTGRHCGYLLRAPSPAPIRLVARGRRPALVREVLTSRPGALADCGIHGGVIRHTARRRTPSLDQPS